MLKYAVRASAILALAGAWAVSAQAAVETYRSGQHIEPAYEGWRQLDDGSYNFIFGYHNENWEEELHVPVGENNHFSPGIEDRGQPTHFLPRRNRFTFTVNVPADWGEDEELVWEITSPNGETRRAYASLRRDYVIDDIVIQSETGALGAGTSTPESRANVPPEITLLGEATRVARVGEAIELRALVEDDGLLDTRTGPSDRTVKSEMERIMRPPSRVTVGKTNGLYLSWNVYRGKGAVEFDPPQTKVWEDTRTSANSPWSALWVPPEVPEDGIYETTVTFKEPGTYMLWGRADDGGLFDDEYVTVHVYE